MNLKKLLIGGALVIAGMSKPMAQNSYIFSRGFFDFKSNIKYEHFHKFDNNIITLDKPGLNFNLSFENSSENIDYGLISNLNYNKSFTTEGFYDQFNIMSGFYKDFYFNSNSNFLSHKDKLRVYIKTNFFMEHSEEAIEEAHNKLDDVSYGGGIDLYHYKKRKFKEPQLKAGAEVGLNAYFPGKFLKVYQESILLNQNNHNPLTLKLNTIYSLNSKYYSAEKIDNTFSVSLDGKYKLNRKVNLIGNVEYYNNFNNALYKNRIGGSFGLSWRNNNR